MLDIHKPPPASDTKTAFTHSTLPAYIDALNPPLRKKPLAAIHAVAHAHTLALVLPAEIWTLVRHHIHGDGKPRIYARAWLTLADILDDAFLDAYVRPATASLLSAGCARGDTHMQIVRGVLRIEMSRPLYERAGLVGTPVEDGGAKHKRSRWAVEYDLTTPSMRKGKKGFERLRWAAREVLGDSRAWLLASASPSFAESLSDGREVLSAHAPVVVALQPHVHVLGRTVVPRPVGASALYDQHDALALLEWLDMLGLGATAAIHSDGNGNTPLDSHLSRYEIPDFGHGLAAQNLVCVRWRGFITPEFAQAVFLAVWKAGFKGKRETKRRRGEGGDQRGEEEDVSMGGTRGGDVDVDVDVDAQLQLQPESKSESESQSRPDPWFSMSAQAFGGRRAWSLMQFASRETLVWEVQG